MQPLHGCLQHTLFTGISNTNMSLAARAECAARNADDLLAFEQLLADSWLVRPNALMSGKA